MNANAMTTTLWEMPIPSTSIEDGGPKLKVGLRRQLTVSFRYSFETGEGTLSLVFEEVEAYRCSFLGACTDAMREAYDRLTDCGETTWLQSVRSENTRRGYSADGLRHLMIYFDDGPCYEFICRSFRVE